MIRLVQRYFAVLLLAVLVTGCDEDNFSDTPYPRIKTLPAGAVSGAGATLRAEILSSGTEPIIDHGFYWGTTRYLSDDMGEVVHLAAGTVGQFDANVNATLIAGQDYYAKAFVATESYVVYGDVVSFRVQ